MDLDDLDSTGVSERVIDAIREWSDWLDDDEDDDQGNYMLMSFDMQPVNRRDAQYAVQSLQAFLPQDGIGHAKTTSLSFEHDGISDEAMDVFCGFLRGSPPLPELRLWDLPQQQFQRILSALQTNTSIKELIIWGVEIHASALSISELLQHRTDFTSLDFDFDGGSFPNSCILPGLRHGHPCLRKLSFESCAIDDEKIRLIVEALVEGDFPVLQELKLDDNEITSIGLQSLSSLTATVLPSLQTLGVSHNGSLFQDLGSTQLFAQKMLMSKGSTIADFNIIGCGEHSSEIINACESADQLKELNIGNCFGIHHGQAIVNQLTQSLPRMNSLCCLHGSLPMDNRSLMRAFHMNTSIVELNPPMGPRIAPIVDRNRRLARVDGLLRPPTATAVGGSGNIMIPPNSLWSWALATVGQGSSQAGATPVFKVLCDRLATWVEMKKSNSDKSNNGKKRKRPDGE